MIPLTYGKPASPDNFPDDHDVWDLYRFFKAEYATIRKMLTERAVANWQQQKSAAAALKLADDLVADVARNYGQSQTEPDMRIYGDAKSGNLERQSPSIRTITSWRVGFWLAVVAESSVMLVQQVLSADFNPFIIVLAAFLALGGFLQGRGIGGLLLRFWKEATQRVQSGDRPHVDWGLIAIGTALIVLIAGLRGLGAFGPVLFVVVFLVTVLFGEAVAAFEALKVKDKGARDTLLQEMAQAQRWQANMSHREELLKPNGYRQIYESAVLKADERGPQIALLDGASGVPTPVATTSAAAPTPRSSDQ